MALRATFETATHPARRLLLDDDDRASVAQTLKRTLLLLLAQLVRLIIARSQLGTRTRPNNAHKVARGQICIPLLATCGRSSPSTQIHDPIRDQTEHVRHLPLLAKPPLIRLHPAAKTNRAANWPLVMNDRAQAECLLPFKWFGLLAG